MTESSIACTLDARQTADRHALIKRLWADGLIDTRPTPAGLRARLRRSPGVERRVRALIDAESRCCAFLTFDLDRDGDQLVLDINGPADARHVIEAFCSGAPA
jgi:hypothetical protein